MKWYGYLHAIGMLQLRQYESEEDIRAASRSPLVRWIYGPFEANTYDDAQFILAGMFRKADAQRRDELLRMQSNEI